MTLRQSQVKVLNIHQFAQICRTTPRTLRFYEQKGLFKPFKVNRWNSYRYYQENQVRDFLRIKLLKTFNISLKEISSVLKKHSPEEYLETKLKMLEEEIKEKIKAESFLKKTKDFLFNDQHNLLKPASFGPYTLFCLKVEHGEYEKIGDYFTQIRQEAKRLKLDTKKDDIVFYLDPSFNPQNSPLEICLILEDKQIPVVKNFKENFSFKIFPQNKALTYKYQGPYGYITLVYQRLHEYISQNNIKFTGPVFDLHKEGYNQKSSFDCVTLIGFLTN